MFVKLEDGVISKYPYTLGDLLQDNPNTSFPAEISEEILNSFGLYRVTRLDLPNNWDRNTQNVEEKTEPELVDGEWVIGYILVDKTVEEIAAYNYRVKTSIIEDRNRLLAETDWMALSDSPGMSAAWKSYRQSLRDITLQDGYPNSVIWPEIPQ